MSLSTITSINDIDEDSLIEQYEKIDKSIIIIQDLIKKLTWFKDFKKIIISTDRANLSKNKDIFRNKNLSLKDDILKIEKKIIGKRNKINFNEDKLLKEKSLDLVKKFTEYNYKTNKVINNFITLHFKYFNDIKGSDYYLPYENKFFYNTENTKLFGMKNNSKTILKNKKDINIQQHNYFFIRPKVNENSSRGEKNYGFNFITVYSTDFTPKIKTSRGLIVYDDDIREVFNYVLKSIKYLKLDPIYLIISFNDLPYNFDFKTFFKRYKVKIFNEKIKKGLFFMCTNQNLLNVLNFLTNVEDIWFNTFIYKHNFTEIFIYGIKSFYNLAVVKEIGDIKIEERKKKIKQKFKKFKAELLKKFEYYVNLKLEKEGKPLTKIKIYAIYGSPTKFKYSRFWSKIEQNPKDVNEKLLDEYIKKKKKLENLTEKIVNEIEKIKHKREIEKSQLNIDLLYLNFLSIKE